MRKDVRTGQTGRLPLAGRAPSMDGRGEDCTLSKKLYVGNLPFSSTEEDLREVFGRHGTVESVAVITDSPRHDHDDAVVRFVPHAHGLNLPPRSMLMGSR